ncbi:MAG TPA: DUF438 domain-containing protein [Thermoanaerobacterales bacterium]|nr:DUF438 domain-containing protein [Thermoanaerobacterales bacterium]
MTELINNRQYRINLLKQIIMELHQGKSVEEVKEKFREAVKDVTHEEVAAMEQALIQEGLPVEEIQKMCDVHASIFKETLNKKPEPEMIPGHPIHTFTQENRALEDLIKNDIKPRIEVLKSADSRQEQKKVVLELLEKYNLLMDIDKHYSRKENLIFPYLEKYGITAPPKVMWGVDDEIRGEIKDVINDLKNYDADARQNIINKIEKNLERIQDMIYKEEKILFPMAVQNLTQDEWYEIYKESDEIGFCLVEPAAKWEPQNINLTEKTDVVADPHTKGSIKFDTGILTPKQIELIFNHLPVDITFVDKDDIVKYFSLGPERIFTRTKAVIGRSVQNCHPPASVHIVEKLVKDFKDGKKDVEEFWINMGGKLIYIRYFAVRDENGEFVGTLEVTQDITRIKEIEGEKRLMN